MKICFPLKTYFNPQSGINSFTDSIVHNLIFLGHQVHIVAADNVKGTVQLSNNLYIHKVVYKKPKFRGDWRIERLFPLEYLLYSWQISKKLNKIVKEYSIDIIESSNWFETFFYFFIKSVPVVTRLHSSMKKLVKEGIFPNNLRTKSIAALEYFYILMSDGIISPSKSLRLFFYKEYKIKKEITVIHNSIDIEKFPHSSEKESNLPTVLFVGRLEEMKGIEFLINAIPKVLNELPSTEFVFIGQDLKSLKYKMKWSEYAKSKIDNQRMFFKNRLPREELFGFYQKCWILVIPSIYEPFGIVALEAMTCGKPVIATNVGGLPEIIEHGRTGILIPPRDSSAIADSIIELIKNKNLRKEISSNSIRLVELKFNAKFITDKNLEFYEKVISSFKNIHTKINNSKKPK